MITIIFIIIIDIIEKNPLGAEGAPAFLCVGGTMPIADQPRLPIADHNLSIIDPVPIPPIIVVFKLF